MSFCFHQEQKIIQIYDKGNSRKRNICFPECNSLYWILPQLAFQMLS